MNSSSAASGEGTAHSATTTSRGRGTSFSTAAVMMPSVPSRPDEQLAQAIAGVVLAQPAQPVPDLAVRQHDLQPQHQVARIAVAHGVVAAGVGRQHAADLRAALGRDRQRQQAARLRRRVLRRLQRDAGLDRHGQIDRVDRPHPVQPRQAEHDLAAVLVRRGAADHRGVAALRHQRHPRRGAQPHHLGELGGVGGPHHRRRAALIQPPPILGVGRGVSGIGQQAARPDDTTDRCKQFGHRHWPTLPAGAAYRRTARWQTVVALHRNPGVLRPCQSETPMPTRRDLQQARAKPATLNAPPTWRRPMRPAWSLLRQ